MTNVNARECSMGNCLRVTPLADGSVALHSSRRPAEVIVADADEWAPFLADVKAGRYDPAPVQPVQIQSRNQPMPAPVLRARVAGVEL